MRPTVRKAEADHFVSFHVLGTAGEVDLPETIKARMVCHFILTQLPDKGLPEAIESLAEMWRFYAENATRHLALLAPARTAVQLKPKYERPTFTIAEE